MLATMFQPPDASVYGAQAGFTLADLQKQSAMNNQINQIGSLQDIYQNEQMNPLKVRNQQLVNAGLEETNKSTKLANEKSVFEMEDAVRLREPKYQEALAKLQASTSENEVKLAHAKIEKDLISPDPKVRAEAANLYKMTGDMIKMYEQAAEARKTSYGVASINQRGQDGRAAAKDKAKADALVSIDAQLAAAKGDPIKTYTLLSAVLSTLEPGSAEALKYSAMLAAVQPVAEAQLQKGAVGKPVKNPDGTYGLAPPVSLTPTPAAATRPERQAQPPVYARNPTTGQRIMSTDGGITWQPAK